MENKILYNIVGLAIVEGMKIGVDANTTSNFFKVVQNKVNNFAQNRRPQLINNAGTVAFLVSPMNRTAGDFSIEEVKESFESRNGGKKGFVATVKWMPPLSMDAVENGDNNKCDTDGLQTAYKIAPYQINRKYTSKPLKISNAVIRCIEEGTDEYEAESIYNYIRTNVSAFARQVSQEIHNLANNYYGNYPDRFKGTQPVSPASKTVNLFRDPANAYNEVNWIGETYLEEERMSAAIPNDQYVYIGGTTGKRYAKLKDLSIPNDDSAFDPSMLDEFTSGNFIFDDYMESSLGVEDPLMLLRAGALQLVTYQKNVGDFAIDTDNHRRGTVVDPFFGLTWDTIWNRNVCGDEVEWTLKLELYWGVWGYPDCPYTDDPLKQGVKDVMLYKIGCGDDPVCSLPVDLRDLGDGVVAYDDSCDLSAQSCEGECNVVLYGDALSNGDYQVRAVVDGKLGATIDSYAWAINGTPIPTPTPSDLLVLLSGSYGGGEVVSLTIQDSTGCQATAELTIEIPNIEIQLQGNSVADGDSFDFGTTPAGTPFVFPVSLINNGNEELVITSIVEVPTNATSAKPATPLTIAGTSQQDYDVTFDSAVPANAQIVIVVSSNDPDTPSYTVTGLLEFT